MFKEQNLQELTVAPLWLQEELGYDGRWNIVRYMQQCLFHQKHGYYQNKQIIGNKGDFTTSPEISQLFGEMLGIWAVNAWLQMDKPPQIQLIELGPGRASMVLDFLNVAKKWPTFLNALEFWFVEASPILAKQQKKRLNPVLKHFHSKGVWVDNIDAIPPGASLVLANEFFDALPIHQLQWIKGQWLERMVELDQTGRLKIVCTNGVKLDQKDLPIQTPKEGDILEICPKAQEIALKLGKRVAQHQGYGLIIDYGYIENAFGETLQGLKEHQYCNMLNHSGSVDLSAHVNFKTLELSLQSGGANIEYVQTQRAFLQAHGIDARAQQLVAAQGNQQHNIAIRSGYHRLIDPAMMGNLFKVLCYKRNTK